MWKHLCSFLFIATLAGLIIGCPSETTEGDEGDGGGGEATEEAPAKVDIPCVDDANKKVDDAGQVTACKLAETATIDGYPCAGGKMVLLHPDGKLKDCYMTEAKEVDGFTCKDGLSLYASGKFRRCKLEADVTVNEVELKMGDWVTAHENGSIKRVELFAGPRDLKGQTCKGYMNFFHENGQLGKCQLEAAATVEGKAFKADEFVCFDDTGKMVECSTLHFDMT